MLPEIKTILFATDLSENADNALRQALGMAKANQAKVHVLHVSEPLSQDATATLRIFMQLDASRGKEMLEERHASVKETLKQNQKQFVATLSEDDKAAYDAVSSVVLIDGHPAETILNRAKALECDLIVMATHEQSTDHTFLGTVAKRVLRRATIPVLLVPGDSE